MEEKTAKIKTISIDNKYTQTVIQFKIDETSKDILELNYIIHAVNGDFSSIPIKILLEGDKVRLLGNLRWALKTYSKDESSSYFRVDIDSFGSTNCDFMLFEETSTKDDSNRRLIEFSFMVNGNMDKVYIPYEIFSTFLKLFIKIVEEKDIEEEQKEPAKEKSETTLPAEEPNRENKDE